MCKKKRWQLDIMDLKSFHQKTGMLPLQDQFTEMAEPRKENYAIVQNIFSPFNFLQASSYDVNLLHAVICMSNPRPALAITAGEMLDESVSPLASLDPGIQVLESTSDTGSSNWNYLKSLSFLETGASRVDQLMPIINPLDIEALSSLSKALRPVVKAESMEDFMLSRIGYPLPNSQGEQANISNNVESEEPAESGVLIERKSKYCSNAAQQSEETMATKKARARKVISSRIYRAKVAEAIKALKNALPCSENRNQASILDNVIDYIKFLKLQLNVLSQNRLNGEASAPSFVHIEGYGHYLLHPQTYHQPLEEMVGHLLKANPQVANELLEHNGLAIVPLDSAYTILQNNSNPSSNTCQ